MPRIRTLIAALLVIQIAGCGRGDPAGGNGASEASQSASGGERPQLAFVTNGVASFWTIAEVGALAAGVDLDADVDVLMPAEGIGQQKQFLEDLITRGIDGVAVSPIDPVNQSDILNQVAEHTNLITHDSDAPDSNRLCYVGMDNYVAGRLCGELVREAMPDGGTVMIFIGRLEQDNAKRRRQGVIDVLMGRDPNPQNYDAPGKVLEGDKFTILDTLTDQFDRAKGKANAEDAIAKYPDLDCMVGLFAYNPPLCLQALEQAGKLGEIKMIGFDEAEETLDGIQKGTVYGTVVQNPYQYAYKSIEILNGLARGDRSVLPAEGFFDIPAQQIRRDNVDEFWAELNKNLGKAN